MNWIKENPKKSAAIAIALALVGGTYMIFGIGPAIQLFNGLLALL